MTITTSYKPSWENETFMLCYPEDFKKYKMFNEIKEDYYKLKNNRALLSLKKNLFLNKEIEEVLYDKKSIASMAQTINNHLIKYYEKHDDCERKFEATEVEQIAKFVLLGKNLITDHDFEMRNTNQISFSKEESQLSTTINFVRTKDASPKVIIELNEGFPGTFKQPCDCIELLEVPAENQMDMEPTGTDVELSLDPEIMQLKIPLQISQSRIEKIKNKIDGTYHILNSLQKSYEWELNQTFEELKKYKEKSLIDLNKKIEKYNAKLQKLTAQLNNYQLINNSSLSRRDFLARELKIQQQLAEKSPFVLGINNIAETLDGNHNPDSSEVHMYVKRCTADAIAYIDAHPLNDAGKLRFSLQLLNALAILHACNIVHRDIKFDNILINENSIDFDLFLTDFGVAREIGTLATDGMVGTPEYLAPEEYIIDENFTYSAATDAWAVGVVLLGLYLDCNIFETLQDKFRKFLQLSKDEKLQLALEVKQIAAHYCPKGEPKNVNEVFGKMLAADPKERLSCLGAYKYLFKFFLIDHQVKNPKLTLNDLKAMFKELSMPRNKSK